MCCVSVPLFIDTENMNTDPVVYFDEAAVDACLAAEGRSTPVLVVVDTLLV